MTKIEVGSTREAIEVMGNSSKSVCIEWDLDDYSDKPVWSKIKYSRFGISVWTDNTGVELEFDSVRDFKNNIEQYKEVDKLAAELEDVDEINGWKSVESENGVLYKFERFGHSVALKSSGDSFEFDFDLGIDVDRLCSRDNILEKISINDYTIEDYQFLLVDFLVNNDPADIQIVQSARKAFKESIVEINGVGEGLAENIVKHCDFEGVESFYDFYYNNSLSNVNGVGNDTAGNIISHFRKDGKILISSESDVAIDPIKDAVRQEKKRLVQEEQQKQVFAEML